MNTLTDKQLKDLLDKSIKEAHTSGMQFGKKETSDLVYEVIKRQKPIIETTIKEVVNENISDLHKKIDDYIARDEEWKKLITPQIEAVKIVQNWGKVSLGLITVLSTIGGFILLTIKLFTGK